MLFPTINLLHSYISTARSMCAMPSTADCYSSLNSCFPGMFLRYFLNECEVDTIAPIVTGIPPFYTPHTLDLCCKVYIFQNLFGFFLGHISLL